MRRAAIVIGSLVVLGIVALVAGFSVAFHRTPMQVLSLQLTPSPQELFGKDHILVLVEGLDYDYNDKDEEYSTQSRSDIIKAVDLDFRTRITYLQFGATCKRRCRTAKSQKSTKRNPTAASARRSPSFPSGSASPASIVTSCCVSTPRRI